MAIVIALLLADRLSMRQTAAMTLLVVLALAAAAAMAWSQVALGAHYETDTVGGFAAAVAVVPATAWLVDKVADHRAE
jgi:undecaprenyl-diphosphatase